MLSIKPLKSVGHALNYYKHEDDYYLKDHDELDQSSQWYGLGAKALGLEGSVQDSDFLSMLEGRLPTGEQLGRRTQGQITHRPGIDLTFSAPKSLSVLALVYGDERLIQAFNRSVDVVLDEIEKDYAKARVQKNGVQTYEATGNLTVARFKHNTSRSLDPQLHQHTLIMNATQCEDGKWRSLASRHQSDKGGIGHDFLENIYNNQHYYGLVQTNALVKETLKLGYEIRIVDQYGNFEIKGVSTETIQSFSKRSVEIKEQLQETGFRGAKAAEVANHITRKEKESIPLVMLVDRWKEELERRGDDLNKVVINSHDRQEGTITQAIPALVNNVKEAVGLSIKHLSQYSTKIDHDRLVKTAFLFGRGVFELNQIQETINTQHKRGELLGRSGVYYTTKELRAQESELVELIKSTQKQLSGDSLQQSSLAAKTLKSDDQLHIIDLKTNRDKAAIIKHLVNTAEDNGHTAYVLHVNKWHSMALGETLKRTNERKEFVTFLRNLFKGELVHTVAGFKAKYEQKLNALIPHSGNDYLIVHDAQKLSHKDAIDLITLAKRSHSKIVFLNNEESRHGYAIGDAIRLMKSNGVESHIHQGNHQQVPIEIRESMHREKEAIEAYFQSNEQSTVVGLSRKSIEHMNALVREHYRSEGQISHHSREYQTLSTESLSIAQRRQIRFYGIGDQVIIHPYSRQQEITRVIEKRGHRILLGAESGAKKWVDINSQQTPVESWQINKTQSLDIAEGERLRLDKPFYSRGIKLPLGTELTVSRIAEHYLVVQEGTRQFKLSAKSIADNVVSYAYVKPLNQLTESTSDIIVPLPSYQADKQLLKEIGQYSQRIRVFTDNEVRLQEACDKNQLVWLASEVEAQKPPVIERDPKHANTLIRRDIERVVSGLTRPEKTQEMIAESAVSYAMAMLGESEAGFRHEELISKAIHYAIGEVDILWIKQVINERSVTGELICAGSYWVTPEAKALELSILNQNSEGQKAVVPVIKNDESLDIPSHFTLGQRDGVRLSLTSEDRFIAIDGVAGAGKSTLFSFVKDIAQKQGFTVIGMAPTHEATKILKNLGIEAMTAQAFVTRELTIPEKTIFIVDESSMIGNRLFHDIQKKAVMCQSRVIFSGGREQNQAIEAGMPFELSMRTNSLAYVRIKENVRQKANPVLKEATERALSRDMTGSFSRLNSIDPEEYVKRSKAIAKELFNSSVIEVKLSADEKKDYGIKGDNHNENSKERLSEKIYEAVAQDFLSRIKEHQENTLVIAHAHEDRQAIDLRIREGLKAQGTVSEKEYRFTHLLNNNKNQTELLHHKHYDKGDIICLGRNHSLGERNEYLTVMNVYPKSNELLVSKSNDVTVLINPAKVAIEAGFSTYKESRSFVGIGDRIRLRKTELDKQWTANEEYTVKEVNQKAIHLENEKNHITISSNSMTDRHWEYAYSSTSYGSQGKTSELTIALELSWRRNVTNYRSHAIDISRPKHQVTIYTDNQNKLVSRLKKDVEHRKADKLSAYELLKKYNSDSIGLPTQKSTPHEMNVEDPALTELIADNMEIMLLKIMGKPVYSNDEVFAYNAPYLLSIDKKTGNWENVDTAEKGTLYDLVKKALGFENKQDAIDYLISAVGYSPKSEFDKNQFEREIAEDKRQQEQVKREYFNRQEGIKSAKSIWGSTEPLKGSLGEKYFKKHRKIDELNRMEIRYWPEGKRWYKSNNEPEALNKIPAIVVPVIDKERQLCGVQRIYLDKQSAGKNTFMDDPKLSKGVIKGNAGLIQRGEPGGRLYLAEGPETGASIAQVDPNATVLTTLSIRNLVASLQVVKQYKAKEVIIAGDNDGKQSDAYRETLKAYEHFKHELESKGTKVLLAFPDDRKEQSKVDWNDVLIEKGKTGLLIELNKNLGNHLIRDSDALLRHQIRGHRKNEDQLTKLYQNINKKEATMTQQILRDQIENLANRHTKINTPKTLVNEK